MNIRPLRAFCVAALLAATGLVHAQIARADAESLVRKSGLWEQLKGIDGQVEAGMQELFAASGATPAAAERARVSRVIHQAYAPDRLRAVSTGVVAARMQPQHVQALQRWFDSPVGRAITRAEEADAAATEDARVKMAEGVRLLKDMSPERRRALDDLIAVTGAADAMVQLTINTAVAAQVGAASALPSGPAMAPQDVRDALEAQRPQLQQAVAPMLLASFANAYASIPTAQLRLYVDFIRTPAGTQFNTVATAALEAALTDAAAEMGRRLPGTREGRNT